MREQGRHFLHAQAVRQGAGAFFIGQPPVLVGIQLAVAVQVLEGVAVSLQDGDAGSLGISQGFAALIGHLHPAVGRSLFFPFLVRFRGGGQGGGQHHHQRQEQRDELTGHDVLSFLLPMYIRYRLAGQSTMAVRAGRYRRTWLPSNSGVQALMGSRATRP